MEIASKRQTTIASLKIEISHREKKKVTWFVQERASALADAEVSFSISVDLR